MLMLDDKSLIDMDPRGAATSVGLVNLLFTAHSLIYWLRYHMTAVDN